MPEAEPQHHHDAEDYGIIPGAVKKITGTTA
jgi:hypothetical protein